MARGPYKGSLKSRLLEVEQSKFRNACASFETFTGILQALGFGVTGSGPQIIREIAQCRGVDLSHVKGKSAKRVDFDSGKIGTKRRILLEENDSCQSCGLTHWLGEKIPLQLDHIDGDADNNQRQNLRLLCGICHTLIPTWGFKGNRRACETRQKKRKTFRGDVV